MTDRLFGHVPGHPAGSWFASRAELAAAGVHRPLQAGISGSQYEGADSVVLSGGYADDADYGDTILYTGQGGRDAHTGEQVRHQHLNRGNLALARSALHGLPVRVVRGAGSGSRFAPDEGYRYEGLYRVDQYWQERGAAGFYVWRFLLHRIHDAVSSAGASKGKRAVAEEETDYELPGRTATQTLRIVRDTAQSRTLKARYDYRCQACGTRLETAVGPYAEAAHIRPLGRPHHGPDALGNLLCLCPNHHVLFDHGAFALADDLTLLGLPGALLLADGHSIDTRHVQYHRDHLFHPPGAT